MESMERPGRCPWQPTTSAEDHQNGKGIPGAHPLSGEGHMDIQDLIVDDREQGIFRYHRSALTSPEIMETGAGARIWPLLALLGATSPRWRTPAITAAARSEASPCSTRGRQRAKSVSSTTTCRHRGALICRHDRGNAGIFQCFYHAWTFNNRGDLIGVPDEEGYSASFRKQEFGLLSPPRVENYRGLLFVSYDPRC